MPSCLMSVYYDAVAAVKFNGEISDFFDLGVGVLQGDTLAPYLFIIVLDWIMRNAITDNSLGFNLNPSVTSTRTTRSTSRNISQQNHQYITDADYCDDIVLFSDDVSKSNLMLNSIALWASKVGLKINCAKGKTEYILVGDFSEDSVIIKIGDTIINRVDDYKYLGSWLMDTEKEFNCRKGQAWSAITKLDKIWKSKKFSRNMKILFFTALIESIFFYNSSTWTISSTFLAKIVGAYNRLLRYALNISWTEKVTNAKAFKDLESCEERLRRFRLSLAGHCWRSNTYCKQPVCDLLFWKYPGSNGIKYYDTLMFDLSGDFNGKKIDSIDKLQKAMSNKEAWYTFVNPKAAAKKSKSYFKPTIRKHVKKEEIKKETVEEESDVLVED